jgi:MFS family permease
MAISSGVWYTGSVFFVALIQHFGRDYASTAGIFSLFTILYGIWGVLVGLLVDRFGPRRVILAGGILLPLALVGSGSATALWQLYVTHSILSALGLSLMGYVPVSVLLTHTFQHRRGLALGIASAGVGVGILALVPLTQLVIDQGGWRAAYFTLAAIAAAVILPVGLFAFRDGMTQAVETSPPPGTANPPIRAPNGAPEWTLASALRSREFWLVTFTFTLLNSPVQLVLTHQIAHLVEVGQPKFLVAGIVGLLGLVSIPGKILWGYLSDRWWPELIYLAGCSCVVASVLILLGMNPASAVWSLYVYATLMGIGYAVSPAMTPILCGRFFGGKHFGAIFGALNTMYHGGGAAGVWLAGYAHDLTGNYRLPLLASIASAAVAAACVWLAAPRRILPPRSL